MGVSLDVLQQVPAGYPRRNELEGVEGNAQKGEDVWMIQVFPCYGLLAEGLRV